MKKPTKTIQMPRKKKTNKELKEERYARLKNKLYERKEMEKLEKFNNTWNDLNSLHMDCLQLIYQPSTITPLLRNKTIMNEINDLPDFVKRVNILHKDLLDFKKRLEDIHTRHLEKTGNANFSNTEELIEAYSIGVEYQNWIDSFNSIVTLNTADILDTIQIAADKANSANANEIAKLEPIITETENGV